MPNFQLVNKKLFLLCACLPLVLHAQDLHKVMEYEFTDTIGVYSSGDDPSTYLTLKIDLSTKYIPGKLLYKYRISYYGEDALLLNRKLMEELAEDFSRHIEPEQVKISDAHYDVHFLDHQDFRFNTISLSLDTPLTYKPHMNDETKNLFYFASSGYFEMSVEEFNLIENVQLEGILLDGRSELHYSPVIDVTGLGY